MQTGAATRSTARALRVELPEFTKGQSCQTLSSGESEYDAGVATTAEKLHLQRLLEFLGVPIKLPVLIDSTAARGIIQRQGCGPLKHIENKTPVASSENTRRES